MQLRLSLLVLPFAFAVACGTKPNPFGEFDAGTGGNDSGTTEDPDAEVNDGGFGGDSKVPPVTGDPVTCEEAAKAKSYVGCDYWPTVTANLVQDIFDFTVAVANVGAAPANVTVTGPNNVSKQVTVPPGELRRVYLPWVAALKGPAAGITASVMAQKSAYHLVSDRPVIVYQFNPLQYKAGGGEPGKDWSSCVKQGGQSECYSYSNDASLLLPKTAMTGNYRVMGYTGFSRHPTDLFGNPQTNQPLQHNQPPVFTITATEDGTTVNVKLGAKGRVVAGTGVAATNPGGTLTLTMSAGDVAEVVSDKGIDYDFSGSLLTADKPVQVISAVPCVDVPLDVQACDHVEEVLFPAETMGKHYVVTVPTGPKDNVVGHVVRIYGNRDATALTYKPSKPAGCPDTVNAGDVITCGEVKTDFEVEGDKEFAVGSFQLGGARVDPLGPFPTRLPEGDPAQSFAVTVEQYRKGYLFLAPTDYTKSYVDVVAETGTTLELDGADVSGQLRALNGTTYAVARIKLANTNEGVHRLTGSKPFGIQVIGYGLNTSYQYPGGLNLGEIAQVPPR